ncbi:L-threonylcarbamoyladenylate synthase, partial [Methylogaea oryzae]|uniref:L-threonylcarbamoyladenylate synthase n=1 Tax=Methylogaea oryzae TaxID=1295382 RepID=UPI00156B3281
MKTPTPETIAAAAQCLRDGGLVAIPTETVYGLGADASNPQAVLRIFAAKGVRRTIRSSSTQPAPNPWNIGRGKCPKGRCGW